MELWDSQKAQVLDRGDRLQPRILGKLNYHLLYIVNKGGTEHDKSKTNRRGID